MEKAARRNALTAVIFDELFLLYYAHIYTVPMKSHFKRPHHKTTVPYVMILDRNRSTVFSHGHVEFKGNSHNKQ